MGVSACDTVDVRTVLFVPQWYHLTWQGSALSKDGKHPLSQYLQRTTRLEGPAGNQAGNVVHTRVLEPKKPLNDSAWRRHEEKRIAEPSQYSCRYVIREWVRWQFHADLLQGRSKLPLLEPQVEPAPGSFPRSAEVLIYRNQGIVRHGEGLQRPAGAPSARFQIALRERQHLRFQAGHQQRFIGNLSRQFRYPTSAPCNDHRRWRSRWFNRKGVSFNCLTA